MLRTKDKVLVLKPYKQRGLECYADVDWAGSWQDRLSNDPLASHSRTGYVIMFAIYSIMWSSKMQPLITLSTTEAEYIPLSSAVRELIAVKNLPSEKNSRNFPIPKPRQK